MVAAQYSEKWTLARKKLTWSIAIMTMIRPLSVSRGCNRLPDARVFVVEDFAFFSIVMCFLLSPLGYSNAGKWLLVCIVARFGGLVKSRFAKVCVHLI